MAIETDEEIRASLKVNRMTGCETTEQTAQRFERWAAHEEAVAGRFKSGKQRAAGLRGAAEYREMAVRVRRIGAEIDAARAA